MFVRLSLAVFDSVSHVDLIPSRAMSRVTRYTQTIARVMREIRTSEIENRRAAGLERLLRDPAWRAQLREELGGYWVIKRWREGLRFHAAFRAHHPLHDGAGEGTHQSLTAFDMCANDGHISAPPPRPKRARSEVRTAANGLFRLAPVPRLPELENTQSFRAVMAQAGYDVAPQPASVPEGEPPRDRAPREWRLQPFPLQPYHLADFAQYDEALAPPVEARHAALSEIICPALGLEDFLAAEILTGEILAAEAADEIPCFIHMSPEEAWAYCLEAAPVGEISGGAVSGGAVSGGAAQECAAPP